MRERQPIFPCMEILVPIKGVLPDQEKILESLLRQDYPSYNVIFLIESEEDPAGSLVDSLSSRFPHAQKGDYRDSRHVRPEKPQSRARDQTFEPEH